MSSPSKAREMLVILGLPRSGTTLLTALLDAHSKIGLYYEPWNAYPNRPRPSPPVDLAQFLTSMEQRFGRTLPVEIEIAGFKETSTHMEALEWSETTLQNISDLTPCRVLWIFRDPIHCFLSRTQGAREWWGQPEASVNAKSFAAFLQSSAPAVATLHRIAERHRGLLVPYEALVRDPTHHLADLMGRLGLEPKAKQLAYYQHLTEPEKIMGDPRLRNNPRPVSENSMQQRADEAQSHEEMIEQVLAEDRFEWIRGQFARLSRCREVREIASLPGSG